MAAYKYVAVDSSGSYRKGSIESQSAQQAIALLRSKELRIVELVDPQRSVWTRDIPFLEAKVKKDQFTLLCRQLATMYSARINLVDAIEIVARQTTSKPLRRVLNEIVNDMRGGSSFSAAAAAHPKIFGTVFVHMIEAGEMSGKLDEMLQRIAIMYEKEQTTKGKVKSAMIYPIIMSIAISLVVIFMMLFIVPTYIENFKSMGVELPLPTKLVVGLSEFLQHFWYLILLGIAIIVPAFMYFRKTEQGKYQIDAYKLKVPIFGQLWHKQAIARFSRTFSSLHAASVPMLQILTILSKVVDNEAIGKALLQSRENVSSGHSLIEPMQASGNFPVMVLEMIAVGEKTGTLEVMLGKTAEYYEADVDMMADRLKALIEPLLIVGMTVAVGTIVLAVILPSFSLMGSMK
ncbi:type II secretion system F family protein [Cohnella faecalis]|uniref:Type II secretion system F family protein n=1 Tax=Cohnella faecalis TaxID=2315694 RepID=A0A398CPD5_9BACL|nr:type II secretion system F family protein [Cohnella faecalis]RIE01351.1 type II secretion system F family protein [Cohnella faecalis]